MKHLDNLKKMKTDKEKWRYIIDLSKEERENLIVMLDNDQTFVVEKGSDDYVYFRDYIGWSIGVQSFLAELGIPYEEV